MRAPSPGWRATTAAGQGTDEQVLLMVGSRAGDREITAAAPGHPGFSGSLGSLHTYRIHSEQVEPLQVVDEAIRVGGSVADPMQGLLHVLHEVSANTTSFPRAIRGGGGDIVTFRVDETGSLQQLERTLAVGARPADVTFAASKQFLVQANRGAGRDGGGPCTTAEFDAHGHLEPRIHTTEHSVVCRARLSDGTLGDVTDVFRTPASYGEGFCAVAVHPVDDCLVACYSNSSGLSLLRLDPGAGRITSELSFERKGEGVGSSIAFHPRRTWLFVQHGHEPVIWLLDCDAARPELAVASSGPDPGRVVSTEASLDGFARGNLVVDAHGTHLYALCAHAASSRGRVVVFEIQDDGHLLMTQSLEHPRGGSPGCGADLSPDGHYFAVPCPERGEVLIFGVRSDGQLSLRLRLDQSRAAHARFYRAQS